MRNNSWAIMFIKMSACIFVATPSIRFRVETISVWTLSKKTSLVMVEFILDVGMTIKIIHTFKSIRCMQNYPKYLCVYAAEAYNI